MSDDSKLAAYIDGLFESGNSVPVQRPWLSAETWAVVKEYLRHGLPLDHDRIEIERIYRQRSAMGLRAYSPLAAALEERRGAVPGLNPENAGHSLREREESRNGIGPTNAQEKP